MSSLEREDKEGYMGPILLDGVFRGIGLLVKDSETKAAFWDAISAATQEGRILVKDLREIETMIPLLLQVLIDFSITKESQFYVMLLGLIQNRTEISHSWMELMLDRQNKVSSLQTPPSSSSTD